MVEYVEVGMKIEKVFDGSIMTYEIVGASSENLSKKFKKVLREDYDIEFDEYSGIINPLDEIIED